MGRNMGTGKSDQQVAKHYGCSKRAIVSAAAPEKWQDHHGGALAVHARSCGKTPPMPYM